LAEEVAGEVWEVSAICLVGGLTDDSDGSLVVGVRDTRGNRLEGDVVLGEGTEGGGILPDNFIDLVNSVVVHGVSDCVARTEICIVGTVKV
jgi:hypothetical protein